MYTNRSWIRRICLSLFALLIPLSLAAQSNRGEVQIYIFSEDGGPLEGVSVELEDQTATSNANGLLNFTYPSGSHTFTLRYEGQEVATVDVSVRAGRVTELILTASPGGASAADSDGEGGDGAASGPSDDEAGDAVEIDEDAPPGTLTGTVRDIDSEEPIDSATIVFRGISVEATTNEDGEFSVEIPSATHTLSVIHPDYATQNVEEVEVAAGETTELEVELTPAGGDIGAVTVFAVEEGRVEGGIAKLIEETRDSDLVVNLIGQEQIGRTGDSDAAGALKRVTGLTVVDDRFVYIRGMGERYSFSLLNGTRLPSPEVDKRVVPLDLFPTGVIESLAVQKTYSPSRVGDFGGGTVGIRTIGMPDDQYARRLRTEISASVAYNDGTTFTERLADPSGSLDWLGIDDGTRALPDEVENEENAIKKKSGLTGEGLEPERREELGESFAVNWEPELRTLPLNYSTSISMRDKFEVTDTFSLGLTGSLTLQDAWDYSEEKQNFPQASNAEGQDFAVQHSYDADITSRDVDIGGIFEIVLQEEDRYRLESSSLLVRATDSKTEKVSGFYGSEQYDIGETDLVWKEQTLFNEALRGRHFIDSLNRSELNWAYTLSFAQSYEPDRRYYIYREDNQDGDFVEEDSYLVFDNWSVRRNFTTVNDIINGGTLSLSMPVAWFGNPTPDFVDVGLEASYQSRDSETRRFGLTYPGANRDIVEQDPNDIFVDDYIGTDDPDEIFDFQEFTEFTDTISASQLLAAAYFSTDVLIFGNTRLSAGLRGEYSRQSVQSRDAFSGEEAEPQVLETTEPLDFLMPGLNLTIPTGERAQFRVGASSTVNRPDLSDLSPQQKFSGAPGAGVFQGNPNLKTARLYNGDLRWEFYPAEAELLSVGAFYKYFQNPIETFALNRGGGELLNTLANIPAAQNTGAELEWNLKGRYLADLIRETLVTRVQLDSLERTVRRRRLLGGVAGFFRDLTLRGNFTYIWSQIDLGEQGREFQFELTDTTTGLSEQKTFANTTTARRLQGQSPYVVNAALGYRNSVSWSQQKEQFTSATVNYNVFGPRITDIGVNGVPDTYEQPFHQLDLVVSHSVSKFLSFGFSAKNLLDLPARFTVGEEVDPASGDDPGNIVQEYRKGRSFSISAKIDL